MTTIAAKIKSEASKAMAAYPQYDGHWNNYVTVTIKRKIVTKLGVAFEKGEIAIARPDSEEDGKYRTVWSHRNKCDTLILSRNVTDGIVSVTDPTNAERKRRLRLREKLGLEAVTVRGVVYDVPPAIAERVRRMCERATTQGEKDDG